VNLGFNATANPTTTQFLANFSNAVFSGYIISGSKYATQLCLVGGKCKIVTVYDAKSITADNWLYGKDGANGIIGLGPNS